MLSSAVRSSFGTSAGKNFMKFSSIPPILRNSCIALLTTYWSKRLPADCISNVFKDFCAVLAGFLASHLWLVSPIAVSKLRHGPQREMHQTTCSISWYLDKDQCCPSCLSAVFLRYLKNTLIASCITSPVSTSSLAHTDSDRVHCS